MVDVTSIWPERLFAEAVANPEDILRREAKRLQASRSDLRVIVTQPQPGARTVDGSRTQRVDLRINEIGFVTVEYPDTSYPALLITGQEPHWRYHRVFDPEGLTMTLKSELLDDERMKTLFR